MKMTKMINKRNGITKVFIVGDSGPEHNSISSIHHTYKGAFKAWNEHRKELLIHAKDMLKSSVSTCSSSKEMYKRIIRSLSCKDPKKIDNYPHETPYIQEHDVEE